MAIHERARSALQRAAIRIHQRNGSPPRTTRDGLVEWARAHLPGRRLVVLSNREPYSHVYRGDRVEVVRNAGGLTVALDAVMQAMGGTWVAHGSGDADASVVDSFDRVACPPRHPRYQLRRLWLSARDHERYYAGFANSALWPLCHVVHVRPRFEALDFDCYRDVNRRFADAALQEVQSDADIVFIQDYHLALAARYLKEARPGLQVAMFWHIPWPNPEVFRILPWKHELLDGLLANDVLGFHIRRHANNFLDCVSESMEARVDLERMAVVRSGQRTWVQHFPISVDADEIGFLADLPETARAAQAIRERLDLGDNRIVLGVDRLDYTKGIPERLEAFERLLERHPAWIGRLSYVQIAVPSRIDLPEYARVRRSVHEAVARINRRFVHSRGPTVHLIESHLDFGELVPYYRLADVCMVTSLHDGMNLVAKEYLAARTDLDGALVLSPFTGAARELDRAWIVSPYDREALSGALHEALSEPAEVRRERMTALREAVMRRNVFDWTLAWLDALVGLGLRGPVTPKPSDPGAGNAEHGPTPTPEEA